MEWIPRSRNDQADFLSRIFDSDDWGLSPLSFHHIDSVWGPHFVDRFANHVNAKLPRFKSIFWNPGSEGIDAFVMNWHGENNYPCPPICLILRVLHHMSNCKASGSLIVPLWHSAPFADDLSRWRTFCISHCRLDGTSLIQRSVHFRQL